MNRGALPLAILIVAALAAGIAVAVIKPGDLGKDKVAGPGPIETTEPLPTATASPEPTGEPTEEPSPPPEPTEEPSPTPEPTDEPSPEPTGGNGDGDDGEEEPTLAETGGPVLPWLVSGVLMFAAGAGLWRLRRRV